MTDAIVALVEGNGAASDINVAYCPMARKSWLQRGEEIRNPYYGKAMADCGRIVRPLSRHQ